MGSIRAFCNPWHATTSPAFRELLVAPLQGMLDVRLMAWGPESAAEARQASHGGPCAFCQILPPPELLNATKARIAWIPMWDDLWQWTQADWDRLPKHLRVVAYSDAAANCAEAAGLRTLRVRMCKDPALHEPARWDQGVVLYYWNRTGLLSGPNLTRLCKALDARTLLYRNCPDPGAPSSVRHDLPARIGSTEVKSLSGWMDREAYYAAVSEANVVVSPRSREGVGMLMLESMARGCAVIGLDAPTMNEYIRHGENGLLLPARQNTGVSRLLRRVVNRARRLAGRPPWRFREGLVHRLDWHQLASHDLRALGNQARRDQEAGFAAWRVQVADLARFLSEWP